MPYWMKAAIIALIAAVAAFFVADLIIPERSEVIQRSLGGEVLPPQPLLSQTPGEPLVKPDEEVPVVTVDPGASAAVEAGAESRMPAMDAKPVAPEKSVDMKKAVMLGKVPDVSKAAVPLKITDTKKAPIPEKTADQKVAAIPEKPAAPEPASAPSRRQVADAPYKIERAVICAAIENRNPADITDKFPKDARQVVYFTQVVGSRDTTDKIIHRWYHNGQLVQTSILPIGSPSWRTHSKRYLFRSHEPSGEWKVEAVAPKTGKVLETATFTVE